MNRVAIKHEDAIDRARKQVKWQNQNTQPAHQVIVDLADEIKRLDDELCSLQIAFDRQHRDATLGARVRNLPVNHALMHLWDTAKQCDYWQYARAVPWRMDEVCVAHTPDDALREGGADG